MFDYAPGYSITQPPFQSTALKAFLQSAVGMSTYFELQLLLKLLWRYIMFPLEYKTECITRWPAGLFKMDLPDGSVHVKPNAR